jgi:DNA topoisomerase III
VITGKRGYGCSGWRDGCPFVLWREHRGQPLSESQLRELLQRRVLGPMAIDGSAQIVLHLTDNGDMTEIPVPIGGRRRRAKAGSAARGAPRDSTGSVSNTGPRRRKSTRRRKDSGTRKPDAAVDNEPPSVEPRPGEPAERFAPAALGPCPLCGSVVVEQANSYACSGWKGGCKFTVWKTIAGKAIGVRAAQSLLKSGHTALLKGFRSKAGKPFDARLKLEGGVVRFDFGK